MAGKEATVYIIDVGTTMAEKSHGRTQTNLDWALEYFWDRVTATVASGRKTAMAGVVGLRTTETRNDLADEDSYLHVSVLHPISQVLMPDVRRLRDELKINSTNSGDAIDALIIAVQMINETTKKLQYARKIVLLTDGRSPMQVDDLPEIKKKILEDKMDLVVLGVDFDDSGYGFKEENKDSIKEENEAMFKTLCQDCNGAYGTLAEAIDEMQMPRLKSVRPVASYKGFMTLGDPEKYDDALTIEVERYPKIMKKSPPSSSAFVMREGAQQPTQSSATLSNGGDEAQVDGGGSGDNLAAVRYARTYQVADENAPGGKKDVEYEELSKGYEYGRTAVHMSESDRNVTTFETRPGLDILGFVNKHNYQRYLDLSRSNMIVSKRGDEKSSMAMSSLIRALYELDSLAIARLVIKENKEPRLLVLAPNVEPDFECLYDTELPFAEDVRNYKFPPLDRVITVSGKQLQAHRNLPNEDLLTAMDEYVDEMDLSTFALDEEGEKTEYAALADTFNPMVLRLDQVIKHRAVFPDGSLPEPFPIVNKYSHPPEELVNKAKSALDRVIAASEVKKVPPKARGKKWNNRKESSKPLSDLDVAALLAQDPKRKDKKIDPKNAIPEFKQILDNTDDIAMVRNAANQLKFIIFDWIKHSVGDSAYGRAVEGIRVMREELVELEEPAPFNDFLKELKKKVLGGELGGERKEMWYSVRVNKLRLILHSECETSEYTEEEVKQFMNPNSAE